jgi:hypothetical protein
MKKYPGEQNEHEQKDRNNCSADYLLLEGFIMSHSIMDAPDYLVKSANANQAFIYGDASLLYKDMQVLQLYYIQF